MTHIPIRSTIPLDYLWSPETTLDSFFAVDIPGLTLFYSRLNKSAYKKPYRNYSNKAISCILTTFQLAYIIYRNECVCTESEAVSDKVARHWRAKANFDL